MTPATGVCVSLAGKYLDREPYNVLVLCDGAEMAEGSMREPFQHARWYGPDNLVAILDVYRLGQTCETTDGWNGDHHAHARVRNHGESPHPSPEAHPPKPDA